MTDAKSASWKEEGQKDDFDMEDFETFCLGAAAEEVVPEFLEDDPRAVFLLILCGVHRVHDVERIC